MTKTFLLFCAATMVLPAVRAAEDNPAQARARAAMEQMLRQPPSTPAAPSPAAVDERPAPTQPRSAETTGNFGPVPGPSKAPALTPAPAVTGNFGPVPGPSKVPPTVSDATFSSGFGSVPPPSQPSQRAIELTREKEMELLNSGTDFTAAPSPNDDAALEKARQAIRKKDAELDAAAAANLDPEVARAQRLQAQIQAQQQRELERNRKIGGYFDPIQGPPLPISAEKQAKLAQLLERYKADEVTPDQYQAERAKILAAP